MIRSIETALPGFVGLREFFRRLPMQKKFFLQKAEEAARQ